MHASVYGPPGPDAVSGPQARDNLRVWGSPRSAMPEFRYQFGYNYTAEGGVPFARNQGGPDDALE